MSISNSSCFSLPQNWNIIPSRRL